jgi:hypothetical protein
VPYHGRPDLRPWVALDITSSISPSQCHIPSPLSFHRSSIRSLAEKSTSYIPRTHRLLQRSNGQSMGPKNSVIISHNSTLQSFMQLPMFLHLFVHCAACQICATSASRVQIRNHANATAVLRSTMRSSVFALQLSEQILCVWRSYPWPFIPLHCYISILRQTLEHLHPHCVAGDRFVI